MKKLHKVLGILLAITLVTTFFLLSFKFNKIYQVHEFNEFEEYNSYTTRNGKYTISLRNSSEAGLSGAVRLNIYLVHNDNGYIEYIGRKRLDYYDDFTPYVKFTELDDEIIVVFCAKYSNSKLEICIK